MCVSQSALRFRTALIKSSRQKTHIMIANDVITNCTAAAKSGSDITDWLRPK